MSTENLLAPELSASQNNKSTTHNAALDVLDGAIAGMHENTNVAGDSNAVTLTEAQFLQNHLFKFSGAGAAFTVTTQGTNTGAINTSRVYTVYNADTTYTLTLQSDAAGDTVDIVPGDIALVMQLEDDITLITTSTGTNVTIPYDIGLYFPGTPTVGQILAETYVGEAVTIADDFAGSVARVATNPTSTFVIDIAVNGSDVGDISFNTSGVPTFTTDSGALSLSAGDRVTFTGPDPVDATAADITILIKGDVT